ncbi:helix-turn-helix transcriptional regulator [Bradyrhizobium canariense]|uniref:HTH luxR-type domain-containing protein n=1 Tax=Bradyrhizobium canariense TaxID=255045 RepID=A0A1H1WNU6_9BRAD|nr:hypothetical protein [Bradyrhizobium canariense]SDS98692.1 hypothetical protein SAMN05444158_3937 [Bradyrhizobium canariense]
MEHLRALAVADDLGARDRQGHVTRSALDAFSVGVAVIDADLRVDYANMAAIEMASRKETGFSFRRAGPGIGAERYLAPAHQMDSMRLRAFVASAAKDGSGGVLQLSAPLVGPEAQHRFVLAVSPVSGALQCGSEGTRNGLVPDLALVFIKELGGARRLDPARLIDLFDLTKAEAEVASLLVGGVGADEVAQSRAVALDTIRTQIRTILAKTQSANLRDFEHRMATLSALIHD